MRRRRGVLLVEVLVALTLLGTVTVTLLVAESRALAQVRSTRRAAEAARLAEQLYADWRLLEVDCTLDDEGRFDESDDWSWRRTVTRAIVLDSIDTHRITIEIVYTNEIVTETAAAYTWLEPIREQNEATDG